MTIKIKVFDLQQSVKSLQIIANAKIPFKISYEISKRLKVIDSALKDVDQKRMDLIVELSGGKMKEDGVNYDLGENMPEFIKQYQEVLDSEIELDISPLNIKNLENTEIPAIELMNLFYFLEEPKIEENDNS